jgi:hypothetical protein
VGSAVVTRGDKALSLILDELRRWLEAHGASSLDAVRGAARRTASRTARPTNPPPIPSWDAGGGHG